MTQILTLAQKLPEYFRSDFFFLGTFKQFFPFLVTNSGAEKKEVLETAHQVVANPESLEDAR